MPLDRREFLGQSVALTVGSALAPEEDEKLARLFRAFLDEDFRRRPLEATRLGDHSHDHRLDDLSPQARQDHLRWVKAQMQTLEKNIAYPRLTRPAQIDYDIFRHHLRRSIWLAENTHPFEEDPRVYNEYLTESVYLLLTQSTLPQATNVRHALARMKALGHVVESARKTLTRPPRVFVETALRQNRGAIAFYSSTIFQLAGETPQLSELGEACRKVVRLLQQYHKFLEEDLLPRADGDWRLGAERFADKFELDLDAGLTPDEVLREAEHEAERVRSEMYVIARQLWSRFFPRKALPPDDTVGRMHTVQAVLAQLAQDHGEPQHLVDEVRKTVDAIRAFIRERDVLRLPEPDTCRIIEMPEFQRGHSVAYLNPAPPLDPKASSYYAISPPPAEWDAQKVRSFLEEYNRYMLQILTIHEAYPGHYVQLEYANRHPSLVRRVLSSGVFAEGWAVYTEQMMLDEGYGRGDLGLRLHQLKFYLRAVINAILDRRMHTMRMTDKEALDLLTRQGFQTEGEALGKIIRAKQSSCQLSTYFVGRMAFQRLRRLVQRRQAQDFQLGRYHEAVLAHGTLPVKYLPELLGVASAT